MKHNIEILKRIFRLVYEVLFTILLFDFFMIIFVKEQPKALAIALVFVIYGISYGARQWSSSYGWLILFHIIPMAIIYFLPLTKGSFYVLAAIDLYILSDAMMYMKRNGMLMPLTDMPWPTFVVSIIIYLFGYYTKSVLITFSAYLIPVVLLVLYLIMLYLEGLGHYVDATRDVTGLPLKRIITTNTFIIGLIITIVIFAIAISDWLRIDRAVLQVGKALLALLRGLVYGIAFIWRVISSFMTTGSAEGVSYEGYPVSTGGSYNSMLVTSVELIGKIILAVFLIYVLYRLLWKLVVILFKKRNVNGDRLEKADKASAKRQEFYEFNRKSRKRLNLNEKIRRLYRLRIERYKYDISLNREKTCRDIEKEIGLKNIGDVTEMTDVYAEVRYGGKDADRELLKKMKRLSKE